jgi:MoaA/NifB/PqqE/SkfB family radical SAM enzyme
MDEFKKLGGKRVEISGGEPLCHRNLPGIVEHAKELGLEVSLFSCGIFHPRLLKHDRNMLRKKVSELKKLKVDKVFVTLHASYAELHNAISRTQNSFRQTVRFIKTLVEEGIPVGVHFVPVHDNFDNIDDLETFCRHLGVQRIGILRFVPQGRARLNEQRLRLSKEQTLELTSLLAEKAAERGSIFRVGGHLDFIFFLQPNHDA